MNPNRHASARATSAALLCALAAFATGAGAQTIYQCGEGRVFSDKPCPGGQAYTVEVDRPDAERRREADTTAAREARLAERLRAERLVRDAAPAATAGPAGFHPASADSGPDTKPTRRTPPKTVRTKKKAGARIQSATPAGDALRSDRPPAR